MDARKAKQEDEAGQRRLRRRSENRGDLEKLENQGENLSASQLHHDQTSRAETTLDSSINGANQLDSSNGPDWLLQHQHHQQMQLDLIRPPTMKPSRSLSIIIGDHGRSTSNLNHLHLCPTHGLNHRDHDLRDHHHNHPLGYGAGDPGDQYGDLTAPDNLKSGRAAAGRLTSKFGHQLHSQYSMPCSLNSRRQAQHTYQIHHALLDQSIIYSQLSIVAKKDFAEEVRALLDIRKFVTDSFILTNVTEVRIETIVETIIDRLVECRQLGHQVGDEAKNLLFVERNSLSMLLGNTMQGLYKSRSDGRLAYDHSWIVATCSLSGLHKRQVAIARFAQPVNFGRQSQEVRFLIIVLAPSKEKLTKSAWETGRTFATMFTDIEFRRRLLKAKNQDEIKVELLVRAETLAREASNKSPAGSSTSRSNGADSSQASADPEDEYQWQLQQQQDELDHRIALRHQMAAAANKSNGSGGGGAFGPHSVNSIDLFDTKMLQHQQAELQKKKEQFRAMRSQRCSSSAGGATGASKQNGKRPSNSSTTSSSASSGKNFHEDDPSSRSSCCLMPCLPPCASSLGSGLVDDLKRRSRFYLSDFTDGFLGERSLYKTVSTTIFLYFSVLLPCIAFGVVDTNNTDGAIDPKKTMIGQALGGLFFAMFSGQPLVVVMTTAPLCIYVKVIYQISQDLEVDFGSFYAAVGLWMALFLFIMSLTNSSNLMKHCTRSTEDIFALFTAFAFGSDGIKEAMRSFQKYYWEPDCLTGTMLTASAANMATTNGGHGRSLGGPSQAADMVMAAAAANTSAASRQPGELHPIIEVQPVSSMHEYQNHPAPSSLSPLSGLGGETSLFSRCQRETCVLFLFLMCGTLWLANSFNSFDRTPYLSTRKREIIKDYALAISVLIFSFIGSYLFSEIRLDVFEFSEFTGLHLAQLPQLSWPVWLTAGLLGFMASVLFYIDQNICAAMVNNAPYKLKKGNYFHLDLLVLAILNTFLSLTGLPWMHGKLPHSHLHSKALADYEERVDEGHIHQIIVNIRETRLTGILVSLLVALSLLAVPYPLSYIPLPVLSGVFLYTALAEFKSNSMVERICLLFTEQVAYPPNHYIRRCPQRKIHLFTLAQIVQLAIVSFIGFYPNPYVNMAFPLAVATFVPIRELFLPKLIDTKYLHSLDGASLE